MKQYKVTMEFITTSSEFCDVVIDAKDENSARQKAISMYAANDIEDMNFYSGDNWESTVDLTDVNSWIVKEV